MTQATPEQIEGAFHHVWDNMGYTQRETLFEDLWNRMPIQRQWQLGAQVKAFCYYDGMLSGTGIYGAIDDNSRKTVAICMWYTSYKWGTLDNVVVNAAQLIDTIPRTSPDELLEYGGLNKRINTPNDPEETKESDFSKKLREAFSKYKN